MDIQEKAILSLIEFCSYVGTGKTKVREILKNRHCTYSLRIGDRLCVNKKKLDDWLETHNELQTPIVKSPLLVYHYLVVYHSVCPFLSLTVEVKHGEGFEG